MNRQKNVLKNYTTLASKVFKLPSLNFKKTCKNTNEKSLFQKPSLSQKIAKLVNGWIV
jgi:hypothetical protein